MSTEIEHRLFGIVEWRLFRATAVLFAIVALAGLLGVVVWVLAYILSTFYNLILPLSVAGILALVLYPVVDFLQQRLHLPRVVAIGFILVAFAAALGAAILLLVPTLVQQIVEFSQAAPAVLSGWQEYLSRRFPGITAMVSARMEDATLEEFLPALEDTRQKIVSYFGLMIGLSFVPMYLFFTLLSGGRLHGHAAEILTIFSPAAQKSILYFLDVFAGTVKGFFQGQLLVALIMGGMFAAGFTLIGLTLGMLIGFVLGLLSIVPYLGTLVGLAIVLPMAYFQPEGGIQLLGLSLVVFATVQLVESWLLTPKIMADRTGLHPALVVISIFFWGTALDGIIGMILAVPLTAFIVALWIPLKGSLTRSMLSDRDRIEVAIRNGPGTEPGVLDTSEGAHRT